MAQKIQTLFIDDIDGSEAEGTVRFGLRVHKSRSWGLSFACLVRLPSSS
jgi:hypothetical protein